MSAWSWELLLELWARFLKRRNTLAMVVQMRVEWAVGLTWPVYVSTRIARIARIERLGITYVKTQKCLPCVCQWTPMNANA